jgi:hypothetical protein
VRGRVGRLFVDGAGRDRGTDLTTSGGASTDSVFGSGFARLNAGQKADIRLYISATGSLVTGGQQSRNWFEFARLA